MLGVVERGDVPNSLPINLETPARPSVLKRVRRRHHVAACDKKATLAIFDIRFERENIHTLLEANGDSRLVDRGFSV
jgi:hypothetical protein